MFSQADDSSDSGSDSHSKLKADGHDPPAQQLSTADVVPEAMPGLED